MRRRIDRTNRHRHRHRPEEGVAGGHPLAAHSASAATPPTPSAPVSPPPAGWRPLARTPLPSPGDWHPGGDPSEGRVVQSASDAVGAMLARRADPWISPLGSYVDDHRDPGQLRVWGVPPFTLLRLAPLPGSLAPLRYEVYRLTPGGLLPLGWASACWGEAAPDEAALILTALSHARARTRLARELSDLARLAQIACADLQDLQGLQDSRDRARGRPRRAAARPENHAPLTPPPPPPPPRRPPRVSRRPAYNPCSDSPAHRRPDPHRAAPFFRLSLHLTKCHCRLRLWKERRVRMSIEIARDVMERSPHAGTAKTLLLCLAIMADREGCCYPSHRTLARYCNVDERQIRRCLRTLEAAGDIQTEGGQGAQTAHGSTNRYRLLGVPASPASPVAPAAPSHWGDTQTPPGGVPLSGGGLQTPPREDIQTPSWGDIQTLPGGVPMSRGGVQDPPGGVYMSSLGGVCRPPRKVIGKVIGKERDDTLTVDAGDDTDDTDDTSSDASLPGDAGVPEAVATAAAPEPPQPVYHRDLLQSDAALDEATLAHLERTQPPLCGTRQRSGGGAAADRAKGTSTARSPRDTTPAPTALPFADPTPPSPSPRAGGGRAAAAADEGTLPDPFAPAGTPGARSRSRLLDPREIARGAAADEEAVQRKVEETLARRPHWREPLDVWSAGKPDYHQARANKVAYWLANPDTAPKKAAEENPYRRPLIRVGDPGWEQRLFPS